MPRLRRLARPAALAAAVLALAAAGTFVGLRLAGTSVHTTPVGDVALRVSPAWSGSVDAYVPLADWGVVARPFSAPLTLHAQARTIEREAALRAAGGDRAMLGATEAALERAATSALTRGLWFAIGGAFCFGLVGLLALLALRERRRALLIGAVAAPTLVAAIVGAGSLVAVQRSFDPAAFERPTFYARGAELVQLLDAADDARRAGDSYVSKVQSAVRSFASLLAADERSLVGERGALLASDLHNNALVLDALGGLVGEEPAFLVGDFGHDGNETEARLIVSRLRALGPRVIAVSGNHDSTQLMRRLAGAGATVLTSEGRLAADGSVDETAQVIDVDGLRVAGFSDPLEWRGAPGDPDRVFSLAQLPDPEAATEAARAELLAWFDALPVVPEVVLVHQNGLAQWLAATLLERGVTAPLTILTGHDHRQHVDGYGPITVVDGGSVGAGGVFGLGQEAVGLGRLHFDAAGPRLRAVDLVRVEPVSGASSAERVVIDAAVCPSDGGEEVCRLDSGD